MSNLIPTGLNPIKEQQPLIAEEKSMLQNIRNKKLFFIFSSYLTLLGVLILGWFQGRLRASGWGEEEITRFNKIAPYLISFFFILLTGFFLNYYLKTVRPFIKDLHAGVKDIIWFNPEKYKTPFFEEFYLKTTLKKLPLVKINRELYDAIRDNCTACISVSPVAGFVFSIDIEGHLLQFTEKDFIIER